jgi:hypothetical protein
MEVPLKLKNDHMIIHSSYTTIRYILKKVKVGIQYRYLHTHVIMALFTVAELWNHLNSSSMDEQVKKM